MEYRMLGRTGVQATSLCLGTMNFGGPTNEDDSIAIINRALDGGINFFDTANVYNAGESERIVGKALKENGRRDEVVLATKVFGRMGDENNNSQSTPCRMGTRPLSLARWHKFGIFRSMV